MTESSSISSGTWNLSGTGFDTLTTLESINSLNGAYTQTQTGTDNYTLVESGRLTSGAYTETVTGSDAISQVETGNTIQGTYSRTIAGGGGYTRTETGGSLGSGSGTNSPFGDAYVDDDKTSELITVSGKATVARAARDLKLQLPQIKDQAAKDGDIFIGIFDVKSSSVTVGKATTYTTDIDANMLSGTRTDLEAYGTAIANNPTAAKLHENLIEPGYQHKLDFGPVIELDGGFVVFGQERRMPPEVTVLARAHSDVEAMVGMFGHEVRHAVDAFRGMTRNARWSEFRAHLQEFTVRNGRLPTATEAQDIAMQVVQNYRHLAADNMDSVLRQIAGTGHGY